MKKFSNNINFILSAIFFLSLASIWGYLMRPISGILGFLITCLGGVLIGYIWSKYDRIF